MNVQDCIAVYEAVHGKHFTYVTDHDNTYAYRTGIDDVDGVPYDYIRDYYIRASAVIELIEDIPYHVTLDWSNNQWTCSIDDYRDTVEARGADLCATVCKAILDYAALEAGS